MKKCPYCAEQIQDEAIKCRYCGSMLNGAPAPPTGDGTVRGGDVGFDAEVLALIARREKIGAIKLVRQRTGIGLKQAKDYVEAVEAGGRPAMPVPSVAPIAQIGEPGRTLIIWLGIVFATIGLWFATSQLWGKP